MTLLGDEPEARACSPRARNQRGLKPERRKTNNWSANLRTEAQLSQSQDQSREYDAAGRERRQEAEREIATRERQLEASAARKVKLVGQKRVRPQAGG